MKYETKTCRCWLNETKDAVLDMATNYAAYLEAQGEKIKPIIYKLDEKHSKRLKYSSLRKNRK